MNAWRRLNHASHQPLSRDSHPTDVQVLWAGGCQARCAGFARSSTGVEINTNVKPGRLSVAKKAWCAPPKQNARPQVGSNVRTK